METDIKTIEELNCFKIHSVDSLHQKPIQFTILLFPLMYLERAVHTMMPKAGFCNIFRFIDFLLH